MITRKTALTHIFSFGILAGMTLCGVESAYAIPVMMPVGGAWVTIYDGADAIRSSLNDNGYIAPGNDINNNGILGGIFATQPGAAAFNVQEDANDLGQASMNFEYFDATPLPVGTATIVNFNITGPGEGLTNLSDTLSITFTGHLDGNNNTSIDLHFLSDNDLGLSPPALAAGPNTFTIGETGQYQDLSAIIQQATGLSSFNLQFVSSDVPEPSSLILAGLGALGILGIRRRKAQAK